MTAAAEASSCALLPGELGIIVRDDGVQLIRAEGEREKSMSLLHQAMVEAVVRCAVEPGFAEECLRAGAERVAKAH